MAYAWQDRVARLSSHLAPAPTHCQVPCGIFDDPATVAAVNEACATIRKAMVQINELSASLDALKINQMTRSGHSAILVDFEEACEHWERRTQISDGSSR